MPDFSNQIFAAVAALVIMAGSFGAVVTVPPAYASHDIAGPALA